MLNSLGKRRETFSGTLPWSYFAQTESGELPGGPNEVAQCFLLEKCPASGESIHMIPAKRPHRERDVDSCCRLRAFTQRTSTGVVSAAVFQMGECQLSLQGMLVWYLPKVFEGRFVFYWCNLPLQNKPVDFFFFSSL